jgi:predicted transposase YbfD/YdcC
MADTLLPSFVAYFQPLPDPRRQTQNTKHLLVDVLLITLCGVIAGCNSVVQIGEYARRKEAWLKTFLRLPGGVPSHDTIARVLALLDPGAFEACFVRWVQDLHVATDGEIVAIDGKTLRRSFDRASGQAALHLVSAWAKANGLVLGQVAVDAKSNEITAIPELLRRLELAGAIVTIDALGCQKEIAAQIRAGDADYVLALKENQPTLYADVERVFVEGLEDDFAGLEHRACRTVERGHGRTEERYYHVVGVPPEVAQRHPEWKDLETLGMVYSERQVHGGAASSEVRFYVSSLKPRVKQFAAAVRSHWGVENSCHWVLDVTFREDESRMRSGHAAQNMGALRRLALSLLRREPTHLSLAAKRLAAGWDDNLMMQVLTAGKTSSA